MVSSFETLQENIEVAQLNLNAGYQGVWIGLYQDLNDPAYSEPAGAWKWIYGSSDCQSTTVEQVTSLPEDDSSFSLTPTCDGATANITGLPGGTLILILLQVMEQR